MAVKYYTNPDKRQTIAVLSGTKYDAVNRIEKSMNSCDPEFIIPGSIYLKCLMPDKYKVVVTCDERDVYDEETGKKIAKDKLMRNYYKSVDKRIAMFKQYMDEFVGQWILNRKTF